MHCGQAPRSRRSPLRNAFSAQQQDVEGGRSRTIADIPASQGTTAVAYEEDYTQTPPKPKDAGSNDLHDHSRLQSPFTDDANFETVSLHESEADMTNASLTRNTPLPSSQFFPHTLEREATPQVVRPNVIAADSSLPQLQLNFGACPTQPHYSASVYHDNEGVDLQSVIANEGHPLASSPEMMPRQQDTRSSVRENGRSTIKYIEGDGTEVSDAVRKENVKGMIQEWEKENGRFFRIC
jgi:hypothetical protein